MPNLVCRVPGGWPCRPTPLVVGAVILVITFRCTSSWQQKSVMWQS
jgi:hypothetical protein